MSVLYKQLTDSLDKRLILTLRDGEIVEIDVLSVFAEQGELVGELAWSNRLEKYPKGRAATFSIKFADVRAVEERARNA